MEQSLVGFGPNLGGLGCNTHEAFSVPRLTVGVSNEVQMVRNLTGGLPVVTRGRLASLGPIWKCLILTHERKVEMTTGGERSAGMQNGQRGKCSDAWDEHVCKWDAHDDMKWDAWQEQNARRKTKPNHRGNIITHSRKWQELELQIWKVTSGVLHYRSPFDK